MDRTMHLLSTGDEQSLKGRLDEEDGCGDAVNAHLLVMEVV